MIGMAAGSGQSGNQVMDDQYQSKSMMVQELSWSADN